MNNSIACINNCTELTYNFLSGKREKRFKNRTNLIGNE